MRCIVFILPVFLTFTLGCKQKANTQESTPPSQVELVPSSSNSDWANAVNSNRFHLIEELYAANAMKVISADSVIQSSAQIADFYRNYSNKITSVESLYKVEANTERGINYELLRYTLDNLKEYIQLVIWTLKDEQLVREFEFTQASSLAALEVDINQIADRRKLWIQLCNSNDAESLVKQLYSPNTLYFNHKPIVKGTADLIKEYHYMNSENYNLNLLPIELKVVNANFAFEIGQCSGSYGGKYILVWKKQLDGNWYVFIDSNI